MATTTTENTETNASETPRKRRVGRPTSAEAPAVREAKASTFARKMAQVKAEDWGTRVVIYLYRLQPYTNRLVSGNHVFIMKYEEPITEARVMVDQGSGKYRAVLTTPKPTAAESGNTIDSWEFEINNPNHPPNIPPGEWIDDPRNKTWAWARPKQPTDPQPQAPAAPGVQIHDALDTLLTIEDRMKERMQPPTTTAPPQSNPTDMLTLGFTMAEKILNTKADNPMIDFMRLQMEASERRAQRAEERFEKAMDELRAKANTPPPPPEDPLSILEKAKKLRDFITGGDGDKDEGIIPAGVRSKLHPIAEIGVRLGEKIFDSGVPQTLAQGFLMRSQAQAQGNQTTSTQPPSPATPTPTATPAAIPPAPTGNANTQMQMLGDFLQTISQPMMNYFGDEQNGEEFAEFLMNGYGTEWIHPGSQMKIPWQHAMKSIGPQNVIQFYRQSPYWSALQPHEERFTKFITDLIEYRDSNETPEPEVIDLNTPIEGAAQ